MGLVLSTTGIGLMLAVAVGTLQNAGMNGRLSLPAVGVCMIIGLILLGGGFGIMATAAPRFDDDEFDRLVSESDDSDSDSDAGNPASVYARPVTAATTRDIQSEPSCTLPG